LNPRAKQKRAKKFLELFSSEKLDAPALTFVWGGSKLDPYPPLPSFPGNL